MELPDDEEALEAMGMPAEMISAIRKHNALASNDGEERLARTEEFINGLDEAQLRALMSLIRASVQDPGYAQYVNGWVATNLSVQYNVCRFCGDKHEKLEDLLDTPITKDKA